jgi:hypothetical protein
MIRYRYQAALEPPAPFVHVNLRDPTSGATLADVPAQVDSAADRTVLPPRLVEALGLEKFADRPVAGLGGDVGQLPTYWVLVGVHDLSPRSQLVFACDGEPWVLLGRDVLNQYRVILDGPASAVEIQQPAES